MRKGDELKDRLHYFESLGIPCTREQMAEDDRRRTINVLRWFLGSAIVWIGLMAWFFARAK